MRSLKNTAEVIHQPRGGFLNPSKMTRLSFFDPDPIPPFLPKRSLNQTVNALCRFWILGDPNQAFADSLAGAKILNRFTEAEALLARVNHSLSDDCIQAAYFLIHFDSVILSGPQFFSPPKGELNCAAVRSMVQRSLRFFESCVPPISIVGQEGFASEDSFWLVEAFNNEPTTKQTVVLVAAFLLCHREGRRPETIGIFNPKTNVAFLYRISTEDQEMLRQVSHQFF